MSCLCIAQVRRLFIPWKKKENDENWKEAGPEQDENQIQDNGGAPKSQTNPFRPAVLSMLDSAQMEQGL